METKNFTTSERQSLTSLYYQRAEIYCQLKQYNKSIDDLKRIITLNDSVQPEIYRKLALCYDNTGNIQGTMENMILAAKQGDKTAKDYIKDLGYFLEDEYNQLF
jgi:lipopolysaccharide biosynthesis regulator YciM